MLCFGEYIFRSNSSFGGFEFFKENDIINCEINDSFVHGGADILLTDIKATFLKAYRIIGIAFFGISPGNSVA